MSELFSWFFCSLVEETKRDGFVDITNTYNKIINSIKAAEEAAKMADKAANDTLEVQDTQKHFYCFLRVTSCVHTLKLPSRLASNCVFVLVRLVIFVCLRAEHKGPGPQPGRQISEEPQHGAEGRG